MINYIFESINSFYRYPTGAVEEGTSIHFKIALPRAFMCKFARLIIKDENENIINSSSLFWCGLIENSKECWECDYIVPHPGLFFYHFEIQNDNQITYIYKSNLCRGIISNIGNEFQITSYKKNFKTPEWIKGGVMYQIFPDRFYFSGENKKNIPHDRVLRKDWFGTPSFEPDEKGVVKNSDYFCGDLKGIEKKLDYFKKLGVTCIYLNPIFEAHSNHRYNTANYEKIDPLLGNKKDFKSLCKSAHKKNIKIILDGVFNHTGDDSIYFNKNNRYKTIGAFNSKESKFFDWFKFSKWPNEYNSWWGFKTLPETNKNNKNFQKYINGNEGIIKKWLNYGADGWRLDVVDELTDEFVENIRISMKNQNKNAILIGEVWEDASNKKSYDKRRKYLLGNELDSVMNYPFRNAIINFFSGTTGEQTMEIILSIIENYPKPVLHSLMNILSTHDTERAITALAGEPFFNQDKNWQSKYKLSWLQKENGIRLMKSASAMQYTLPGIPCIYYGDEAGLEGYKDPFSRMCYPWGKENNELIKWYEILGNLRKTCSALRTGDFYPDIIDNNFIAYTRSDEKSSLFCAFNSSNESKIINLFGDWKKSKSIIGSKLIGSEIEIPAQGCSILLK